MSEQVKADAKPEDKEKKSEGACNVEVIMSKCMVQDRRTLQPGDSFMVTKAEAKRLVDAGFASQSKAAKSEKRG